MSVLFLSLALVAATRLVQERQEVREKAYEITQTLIVCPLAGAGCDYVGGEGIQQAVEAAPVGSADNKTKIIIKTGNYTRQNYTEYIRPDGGKENCFIDTKEKYLIFEGEEGTKLDGANSTEMSSFCGKGGETEIKNLIISGFKKDKDTCLDHDTQEACSRGFGVLLENQIKAEISNNQITDNQEVGIALYNSSQATINNNKIADNHWGIYLANSSQATISNNTVSKNGYGIYLENQTKAEISNNQITNNQERGIALVDSSQAITISDNQITGNQVDGIILFDSSQATISNNQITGNNSRGIELQKNAQATISDNQITGNQGGGIILFESTQATINNNTVFKNGYRGIGCGDSSRCKVVNNISVGNTTVGISGASRENFEKLEYNLSFDNKGGNYNDFWTPEELNQKHLLSADPLFVNPDGGDFHLKPGSPAINSGDPSVKDPDGSPADMGVYGGEGACGSDPNLPGCQGAPTSQKNKGDFNNDGRVDEFDYGIVIAHFGEEGIPGEVVGDANCDGRVDEFDYGIVIAHFGEGE